MLNAKGFAKIRQNELAWWFSLPNPTVPASQTPRQVSARTRCNRRLPRSSPYVRHKRTVLEAKSDGESRETIPRSVRGRPTLQFYDLPRALKFAPQCTSALSNRLEPLSRRRREIAP